MVQFPIQSSSIMAFLGFVFNKQNSKGKKGVGIVHGSNLSEEIRQRKSPVPTQPALPAYDNTATQS